MNRLTALERELLKQFESLASSLQLLQDDFTKQQKTMQELSSRIGEKLEQTNRRCSSLETQQSRLAEALKSQSGKTSDLIGQVNTVLNTLRS
jgi:predicted nuclease with TOPRIM domain